MSRERNLEIAKGLREAADWIEANADLPMTPFAGRLTLQMRFGKLDDLKAAASRLGSFEKQPERSSEHMRNWYFMVRRGRIGNDDPVVLDLIIDKSACCEKKIVMKPVEEYECPASLLENLTSV